MSIFKNEDTHPLSLLRKYLELFGVEALEWEPTVIRKAIEDSTGTSVAKINLNKLFAAISVANRDSFWRDWESFHFLSQCLNNNLPSLGQVQNQTIGQLMVAVDIANSIREDLQTLTETPSFSEEVARYVAAQALESGIWFLPPPLDFANKYACGDSQECRDCGNIEELQVDGLCSYCVDRYDTSSLLSFSPDPDRVSKGQGTNVVSFKKHPTAKVEKRLSEALTKDITLKETQVDICVAKLMVGIEYLRDKRKTL